MSSPEKEHFVQGGRGVVHNHPNDTSVESTARAQHLPPRHQKR